MESKRVNLINECKDKINRLEFCNKNDENMLERIKDQGTTSFVLAQIEKTREKINTRLEEIEFLENKIKDIPIGKYDAEIKSIIDNTIKTHNEKQKATNDKKALVKEYKKTKEIQSQKFHKASLHSDRENRYKEKEIQRSYNQFVKASETVPDFMKKNLEEMPENKGYYWRNIVYFGKLPAEPGNPLILFKKEQGGILIIHEWTESEYKVYKKIGKDKRKLISSELRKKININL